MTKEVPTRIAKRPDGTIIRAYLRINGDPNVYGDRPYFSLTGDIVERGQIVAGGQLHDELLKQWPDLQLAADLHLSDLNGVPMHAESNGWYWLAGYLGGADQQYHGSNDGRHTPEQCLEVLIDHIHLPSKTGWRIAFETLKATYAKVGATEARKHWQGLVEAMKPHWKEQAEQAIAQYGLTRPGVMS